jgi:hypothetical protein
MYMEQNSNISKSSHPCLANNKGRNWESLFKKKKKKEDDLRYYSNTKVAISSFLIYMSLLSTPP